MFDSDWFKPGAPPPKAPEVKHPDGTTVLLCVHCSGKGCDYCGYDGRRRDGPEKWAFMPGVAPADVEAAKAEALEDNVRAPGSASPIHLVIERKMLQRLKGPPR